MLCNSASFPDRILSTDSATVEASKKAAEQALEIAENNVHAAASALNRMAKQAVEQVKAATRK
jgi:hypothetical protein